ncbi:hypothetical protein CBS147346_5214 [Aspergillus niger]|nr:hypothetical protein CBS147346_5214 [Aspergillus niger]
MVALTEARASNRQLTPATVPQVSVFVGATSGIGKATLTELVSTGFPMKVYVIGRDEAAFQPSLAELRALNPCADMIFLQGEISLMAETKRLTDIILRREGGETGGGVDLLFLSSGFLPTLERQETTEGIELAAAVSFYSRQVFIRRLLPLLRMQAAAAPRTPQGSFLSFRPRIVNILSTGLETADLYLDDLHLKEPGHFTFASYAGHVTTMTSVSLKQVAEQEQNREIVIVHHNPGLVFTDIFKKSWGDQWDESKPADGPSVPADIERSTPTEAGERSLYVMTTAKYGGDGVSLGDKQQTGLTVQGTKDGSLFCVGDKLETLDNGDLLQSLVDSGAADAWPDLYRDAFIPS